MARTTKQVKKQFSDMSAQMREKMTQQERQYTNTSSVNTGKAPTEQDDYIEFEEVKK